MIVDISSDAEEDLIEATGFTSGNRPVSATTSGVV
jgi:hypothetical protein